MTGGHGRSRPTPPGWSATPRWWPPRSPWAAPTPAPAPTSGWWGAGASGDLLSAYFGSGEQILDFRTYQDHAAPDTTSNLLYKGAVGDSARSVYTGLIRVRPNARGTNAFQTNRNLKLSDDAWAESVPNLEIENNDVRCSHASAVGPVDPEQVFYLESRGVPTPVAERLIVSGFFDEVIDKLPVRFAGEAARQALDLKLNQMLSPGAA